MTARRKRYDTLQALLSPEAIPMARWRGEQRGSLKCTKTGWHGKWREYVDTGGVVEWKQTGWRKLCGRDEGKARAIELLNERLAIANGPAAVPQGVAVRHLRNALSAILRHAKGLGMWRGDLPTDLVRTPEVRHKQGTALSADQVTALLVQLAEPYRTLVLLLASTGLRIGEALALDWEHCNFEDGARRLGTRWLPGRTIAVRRNWTHGEMGTLKTHNSVRNVPVTDELAARLELHAEPGPWGWLVFPNRKGEPLDAHNIAARHLKPACVAAGVPAIGWHALRHTALTLMDQQGMSPTEKRLIAGHGSERVTERYTHGFLDRARSLMPRVTSEVVN